MMTPMALICKVFLPAVSTFETPPPHLSPPDHGWASELLSLSALPTAPHLFLSRPAGPVLGVGHHFFCPGAPYAGPGLALHASWPLPHPAGLPGALTSCHRPRACVRGGNVLAVSSPAALRKEEASAAVMGAAATRPQRNTTGGAVIAERATSAPWWLRLPPDLMLDSLSAAVPRYSPWPLGAHGWEHRGNPGGLSDTCVWYTAGSGGCRQGHAAPEREAPRTAPGPARLPSLPQRRCAGSRYSPRGGLSSPGERRSGSARV